jgi:hypothetical protein
MTEEETMEISESFSALAQLDERDTAVKESVVAYLMWHSGEVLDKSTYPNRNDRARRIDELGELAIGRSSLTTQIRSDQRRVLATHSLFTQARTSRDEPLDDCVPLGCKCDSRRLYDTNRRLGR